MQHFKLNFVIVIRSYTSALPWLVLGSGPAQPYITVYLKVIVFTSCAGLDSTGSCHSTLENSRYCQDWNVSGERTAPTPPFHPFSALFVKLRSKWFLKYWGTLSAWEEWPRLPEQDSDLRHREFLTVSSGFCFWEEQFVNTSYFYGSSKLSGFIMSNLSCIIDSISKISLYYGLF